MRVLHLSPSLTTMKMFVYYRPVLILARVILVLALPIFADICVANGR